MQVGSWFVQELKKASPGEGGSSLTRQWRTVVLGARYRELEKLSGEFEEWWLRKSLPEPLSEAAFAALLNELERRITYLGEPLALVESDQVQRKALLRSRPPLMEGEEVAFFQLTVSPEIRVVLHRMRNRNRKTEKIPFVLSYSVLERLVNDVVEIVGGIETQ